MKKSILLRLVTSVLLVSIISGICPLISFGASSGKLQATIASSHRSLVIKSDGSLWAWGDNSTEASGNSFETYLATPAKIMDDVLSVASWSSDMREDYCLAIKNDGTLWAWGSDYGSDPIKIMDNVIYAQAMGIAPMAIKGDNSLWAWGSNYGSTPQKILDNVICVSGNLILKTDNSVWEWNNDEPVKIMDNVSMISGNSSGSKNCVIKTDGSLWFWGNSEYNYNGTGTPEYFEAFNEATDKVENILLGYMFTSPTKVADGILIVATGNGNPLLIKSDNSLCELKETPEKIMDNVAFINQSNAASNRFNAMAVKNDGTLWAWGDNTFGQLGDGTTIDKPTPIKIMDNLMLQKVNTALNTNNTSNVSNEDISVIFNGEKLNLTLSILNVNGRTMYPFRECLEAMGANVEWISETKTAKGILDNNTVEFELNSGTYTVNGNIMQMDEGVKAFLNNNATYIPIRYAAEALGFNVDWDNLSKTIIID